ncbi:MAG TPA: UDP-N-acetylglucosamine 2-epimerase (non-hydrolyzing) [Nitrososphaera sp.]|nr:UDP-N-acetylglucosamine 2-epimerase (non-hydrolyzing) [Nitrososphaera sp.]
MQVEKNVEILTIAGTRPEIIKLSHLVQLLNNKLGSEHALLYTGQHYSDNMKDIFFDQLGIKPDYDLGCDTSQVDVLKDNMIRFMKASNPEYVLVYGDTSSSMAAALTAKEIGSKLVHIEAGIRDFDLNVPEEVIRIKIDEISDYLFAPSKLCATLLEYEGVTGDIHVTGNLIVDVCKKLSKEAEEYSRNDDLPSEFLLLTMHRQENVDDPEKLEMLSKHLKEIGQYKVVFPVHPRTRNNLRKYNIKLPSNVLVIDPVGYLDFLYLLKKCKLVLTDSGGVQEEAIILGKPCITLRHSSARWETILLKANRLFPLDRKDSLYTIVGEMLAVKITQNPYGENVAQKMFDLIHKIVRGERP